MPVEAMKEYAMGKMLLRSFLTSTLDYSGEPYAPAALPSGKDTPVQLNSRLGGFRTGTNVSKKRNISFPR
jgi:hypothetical protein